MTFVSFYWPFNVDRSDSFATFYQFLSIDCIFSIIIKTSILKIVSSVLSVVQLGTFILLENNKMATDQVNQNEITGPTCMQSVNRITKLPTVETTIQTATNIYEKVKEYNGLTNWTLSTAESTVQKAVEVSKPITDPVLSTLEGSIKKVDGVLCSGLDYVEEKVPAVKLPPGEIYTNTKEYVNNAVTPAVECAYAYAGQAKEIVEPKIKQAKDLVDPVVQTAMHKLEPAVSAVQPTVTAAKNIVEPLVQPAMEKAQQLKDYGKQKVDEYLHKGHSKQDDDIVECQECQDVRENMEKKSAE
ncbi:lipid storage droplets surface-binding protein 1 isoform X2 [Aethina tumida]|uniref:lipid storage droplets surface-binding protein 1 isoform X2 n=1 Tax=Aethina tumida TaxID=116153 RepID=UPI00096AFA9F|nr:lipid storage droplets surface-binding protein 1 isoform X2 [Aethina tumida]